MEACQICPERVVQSHRKAILPKVTQNVLSEGIMKGIQFRRVSIYTRRNLGQETLHHQKVFKAPVCFIEHFK